MKYYLNCSKMFGHNNCSHTHQHAKCLMCGKFTLRTSNKACFQLHYKLVLTINGNGFCLGPLLSCLASDL